MSNSDNLAPPEKLLRDKLCQRLDLIESGLTLISKEEYLRNDNGSSGFIDILSRDKFGNLVIIELKRANSPARQAIHELCKYLALMKLNHGISANRLRCIIVSTTWHELRTPFFEFKNSVPFDVEGYQLFLDTSQSPYQCELVEEGANQETQISICPMHWILLFTNQDDRNSASTDLITFLKEAEISDYCCLIWCDYHGSNSSIIFPYAIYYLPNRIPKTKQEQMLKSNLLKVGDYGKGDLPDWQVEEAIMSRLHTAINISLMNCSFEIGTPEKLLGIFNLGWTVTQIVRTGHMFHSEIVYSDKDIIRYATGVEGANSIIFSAIGTPRRRSKRLPRNNRSHSLG
ncbi:MAG: endonuclease NucS [Pseudanabaena sp. CAN_BIN31]|nr:endonuclease NucS [Pseudanabaena sp. CAN_BIN31]